MMNWLIPWHAQKKAYSVQRQRHAALEAERRALLQISAQGQQLMATVSHALRTPMHAILGFMHLLQTRAADVPEALQLLHGMRRSADHLLTVINDVLDDASLDTGAIAIHAETFPLRETLNVVFDLFRTRAQQMDLRYTCDVADDVPVYIHADRHRLTQVLLNLMGNALKFTTQGHVTLRVQQTSEGVMFSVEDTGLGISETDQARIFQRFEQADPNTQRQYGGYGLGLSISQRLVTLMGGRMCVQSVPGQGSTFGFTLPLSAGRSLDVTNTTSQVPDDDAHVSAGNLGDVRTFLVVDDHAVNRLLLTQLLKTHCAPCEIFEAESGVQAVHLFQQHRFDLVLMDMVMPEMDGIATMHALRQNPHAPDTPVLGLTANINPQDIARFSAAGVNAVVLKPFDAAKLFARVGQLLKEKKSSQGS